ncbi:MAG: hypothetical protein MAG794_00348 [Gammaproteobacteria bacterium]|nr:hypothetical protein [Gammaproteobacteria bacterium]
MSRPHKNDAATHIGPCAPVIHFPCLIVGLITMHEIDYKKRRIAGPSLAAVCAVASQVLPRSAREAHLGRGGTVGSCE